MRGRAIAIVAALAASALVGCGSADSTAAKTPEPSSSTAAPASPLPSLPLPTGRTSPPPTTGPGYDPCATNLAAPAIARAVAGLPPDPRSGQGWNPEPLAGNYNECAQLSVVIVKANTNAERPNTRALMFHQGKLIPTGVPDTFGFNGIDATATTGDTVALRFSNGIPGLDSVVRYRWNGNNVELVAKPG